MNRQTFQSLIIDRYFGELSSEALGDLEAYLAKNATARDEAQRILATLATTQQAVLRYPELARDATPAVTSTPAHWPWLAWAASVLFLATLTGIGGFMAGRAYPFAQLGTDPGTALPNKNSPWTRYQIASNPAGSGLRIMRLDNNTSIK